jgi:hypothetical protein
VHTDRGKRVADLVELERLDDGHDDFHTFNPRLGPVPACAGCGLTPLGPDARSVAARQRHPSRIKPRASSPQLA